MELWLTRGRQIKVAQISHTFVIVDKKNRNTICFCFTFLSLFFFICLSSFLCLRGPEARARWGSCEHASEGFAAFFHCWWLWLQGVCGVAWSHIYSSIQTDSKGHGDTEIQGPDVQDQSSHRRWRLWPWLLIYGPPSICFLSLCGWNYQASHNAFGSGVFAWSTHWW